MRIPILDLSSEIRAHRSSFQEAFQRVLDSTEFIQGSEVRAFEGEIAAYLGVKHAIGLNSGTDALVIGLRALGIGPGDEVITPAFTFYATAEAVSLVGAEPVFADIDPVTFNLDPEAIAPLVTPRTKAVIPVHLFGQSADMDSILAVARQYRLAVLEDTAQAIGADFRGKKLGTLGDMGAFSFYPTKNLGAFGDGGLLVTDRDDLARLARMLANHGSSRRYHNELMGYNSRLDSIQAAVLRVKLSYLDEANQARRRAVGRYRRLLEDVPGITPPGEAGHGTHVYHQFTVRIAEGKRNEVHERLGREGVGTMIYYPIPVPHLKVYDRRLSLPRTEAACRDVLSLPLWPEIDEGTQKEVVRALREATAQSRPTA